MKMRATINFDKFLLVFVTLIATVRSAGMLYPSPCPNIFNYGVDKYDELIGIIDIPYPDTNVVLLNLELSVGNRIQDGFNGHVQLAYGKEKTLQDVMNRRMITYYLHFPYWERTPPRITKIMVNNVNVCAGPSVDRAIASAVTVVMLQHTLTLRVTDILPVSAHSRPSAGDADGNGYRVNNINFNPQPPKDPSRVYNKNVFLSSFTTTKRPFTYGSKVDERDGKPDIEILPSVPREILYDRNPFLNGKTTSDETTTARNVEDSRTDGQPFGDRCGRLGSVTLVANGNKVSPGTYPWLVAIYAKKNTGLEFNCGGTLVSDKHVVSAAHCFRAGSKRLLAKDIVMTLGRNNIMDWEQSETSLIIGASLITLHPDYVPTLNNMTADADVAVITLKKSIQLTNVIRPICLWLGNANLRDVVGESGVVVGWGGDESASLTTTEPRLIKLPIVEQNVCRDSHPTFKDITSERTFCAGKRNGAGPCNGDSGGGFILERNGRWMLRGVVSMSILDQETRCDLYNYFVFVDVAKFMSWLMPFLLDE